MSDFIRSVVAQNASIAAGETVTYDLPTNPLSHLIFTIRGLNVTDEASLGQILSRLTSVNILYRGSNIISMNGADLNAMNAMLFGHAPMLENQVATDNAARTLSLIIPLGRKLYDGSECFPATNRGELQCQIVLDSTVTDIDNIAYQIESVELPGAKPTAFLKATTLSLTPASVGAVDLALPIANKYAYIMLYSTTVPSGTTFTTTISKLKLLANSKETYYALANWESLHGELVNIIGQLEQYDASADNDDFNNYSLLNFDPTKDGAYILDSKGMSQLVLRVTAGDTNIFRAITMELVAA